MPAIVLTGAVAAGAVLLYAVFGGADFGGGVWDLLAAGPRRTQQREAIGNAMGPVWETNHVWLIFIIVTLFTCFPPVFAKLSVALYAPISLALFGIVMRGAAFAFRGPSTREFWVHRLWGQLFGVASLLTPFFFGTAAAAIATGSFAWLHPFALAVGLFAVTICAQLAAVFLCVETRAELQEDFRMRALVATAAVALAGLLPLGLSGTGGLVRLEHALVPIAIAVVLGIAVFAFLWSRRFHWARVAVALEVVAVLCGWFWAQLPFLEHDLGLPWKAAPYETLVTYLWITAAGGVVLVPSIALLFAIFKTGRRPIPPETPQ